MSDLLTPGLEGGLPRGSASKKVAWVVALDRLVGAYAEKTLRAHHSDFAVFAAWCGRHERASLPATAETLAGFVGDDLSRCAARTTKRRLDTIRLVHKLLGLPDATRDPEVHFALRRALRTYGRPSRQALGLTSHLRDQLLAACPLDLKGVRDRALIAVGYDTLCRRSELVNLQFEDLEPMPGGMAKVRVARAKNDPFGEGRYAYISRAGLAHLHRWLAAADVSSGPIFRPTFITVAGHRALHPRALNRALQDAARRAGLNEVVVNRLSGHSLRVGAAQDLVVAGHSVLQVMRAGRWTHVSAVEGYVRLADVNVWAETRLKP